MWIRCRYRNFVALSWETSYLNTFSHVKTLKLLLLQTDSQNQTLAHSMFNTTFFTAVFDQGSGLLEANVIYLLLRPIMECNLQLHWSCWHSPGLCLWLTHSPVPDLDDFYTFIYIFIDTIITVTYYFFLLISTYAISSIDLWLTWITPTGVDPVAMLDSSNIPILWVSTIHVMGHSIAAEVKADLKTLGGRGEFLVLYNPQNKTLWEMEGLKMTLS